MNWSEQHKQFERRRLWATVRLVWLLCRYWKTIQTMASRRHLEGFQTYGDEMYRWKPAKRLVEVLCELSDAIVYLTSGPVRHERARFVRTTEHFLRTVQTPPNDSVARCKAMIDHAYDDPPRVKSALEEYDECESYGGMI